MHVLPIVQPLRGQSLNRFLTFRVDDQARAAFSKFVVLYRQQYWLVVIAAIRATIIRLLLFRRDRIAKVVCIEALACRASKCLSALLDFREPFLQPEYSKPAK